MYVYVVRVYVLYVTSGSMYVVCAYVCWYVLCDRGYGSMYVVRVCIYIYVFITLY